MKLVLVLCMSFFALNAFCQHVDAYESPYPLLISGQEEKSFIEIAYEQNAKAVDEFLNKNLAAPGCKIEPDRMWTESQFFVSTISRKYFACEKTALIKYRCDFDQLKKGPEAGRTEVSCRIAKMKMK